MGPCAAALTAEVTDFLKKGLLQRAVTEDTVPLSVVPSSPAALPSALTPSAAECSIPSGMSTDFALPCTHTYIHTNTHKHTHTHTHTHAHPHTHTHLHLHTYTHIHTHTYIHTTVRMNLSKRVYCRWVVTGSCLGEHDQRAEVGVGVSSELRVPAAVVVLLAVVRGE